jgi:hypothetical protein
VTLSDDDRYSLLTSADDAYDRDLYKAPAQLPTITRQSPNILILDFEETLPSGKTFHLSVTGIVNPSTFGSSKLSLFTYQYSTDQILEYNANVLQLQIQ